MQSSERNGFIPSQSRADSAFHMPRTVSSTDTCQLTFCDWQGWSLVRGAQEAPGASLADQVGGLAVDEHRAPADQYRLHGVVVAVHHAGQAAVLLDTVFGVGIE